MIKIKSTDLGTSLLHGCNRQSNLVVNVVGVFNSQISTSTTILEHDFTYLDDPFMEQTCLIATMQEGLHRRILVRDAQAFWTFFHARPRCRRQSRHHRAISEYRSKRAGPDFYAGRKRHHWCYGLVRTGIPITMQRCPNSPVLFVNTNSVKPSVGASVKQQLILVRIMRLSLIPVSRREHHSFAIRSSRNVVLRSVESIPVVCFFREYELGQTEC